MALPTNPATLKQRIAVVKQRIADAQARQRAGKPVRPGEITAARMELGPLEQALRDALQKKGKR